MIALSLLHDLEKLQDLGLPVLAGLSRKSMIGAITGKSSDNRMIGSVTLATLAAMNGANILRVHDVKEAMECISLISELKRA